MSSLQSLILRHQQVAYLPAAAALSALSLTPTPSFSSLVLLLTVVRLYAQQVVNRQGRNVALLLLLLSLTLGSSLSNGSSALLALSSPVASIFTVILLSLVQCILLLSAVAIDVIFVSKIRWSVYAKWTAFPMLWSSYWVILSHISPFGRLFIASPLESPSLYEWTTPVLGQLGVDWLVGAWAVVLSEVVGSWIMGINDSIENEQPILFSTTGHMSGSGPSWLAGLLLIAAVPSFVSHPSPLPVSSVQTTPILVGCVMPSRIYDRKYASRLESYIAASQQMTSAKIILWPENAVAFSSEAEKKAAFEKITNTVPGPLIGVGYEETLPAEVGGRAGLKRNGFALIGSQGVLMEYGKRHLVPVAESFNFVSSNDNPPLVTVELTRPSGSKISRPDWSASPKRTRPISVTASICLDFAFPSAFLSLPSRPSLILAPGKTWDHAIGQAMWEQARTRAREIGSALLWCDPGGVSGLSGSNGVAGHVQVGEGSWLQTVAVPYPAVESKTVHAKIGDWWTIIIMNASLMAVPVLSFGGRYIYGGAVSVYAIARARISRKPEETRPLLD